MKLIINEMINLKATMVKRALREGLKYNYYLSFYYQKKAMKKHFEELEINGELYSGTYYESETRSKLAWDEWHLSNLESVEIELITVQRYDPETDSFVDFADEEIENEIKLKLGAY